MTTSGEDAYVTLLMSDSYLPGALVLAHSLRDAGTKKKLAAMVTLDTLSTSTVTKIKEVYDYLLPVERLRTPNLQNLYLMDRADLSFTFTKIALWRQLQFRRIVYIDADIVALRAPDELFGIEAPFAAAPDVGWPDAFNTGVMVISPNMGDYWALQTMAASGDSFDGADQGLLNQYYEHKGWHRISFTYNCTPNAQYQWEPAYRYYKSNLSMVHFIGKDKPWSKGKPQRGGPGVYNELLARWWSVHDKHREQTLLTGVAPQQNDSIQTHTQQQERVGSLLARDSSGQSLNEAGNSVQQFSVEHQHPVFEAPQMSWDATRAAPPLESAPEAQNFPTMTYEFNESSNLFKPPPSYPEPPKNMWYEVPQTKPRPEETPPPIFPWEMQTTRPRVTRVFAEDFPSPQPTPVGEAGPAGGEHYRSSESVDLRNPEEIDVAPAPFSPTENAWDSVPGIESYVRAVIGTRDKKNRPPPLSALVGMDDVASATSKAPGRRESLIITNFPSAEERPSLPVTPAPIRRPTFWGDERNEAGELPAAEGVPDQAEWDPVEQLEQLRRSSILELEHLKSPSPKKEVPTRELPEHSLPLPSQTQHHHPGSSPSPGAAAGLQSSRIQHRLRESIPAELSETLATDPDTEIAPPPVPLSPPVLVPAEEG